MRKLLISISLVIVSIFTYSQVLKTVNVVSPGTLNTLLSDVEKVTITDLTVVGNIDARDFVTMRDKLPLLALLDISDVNISAYSGTDGTYVNNDVITFPANELPQYAFFNNSTSSGKPRLKSVIFPTSISSIGSIAFWKSGLTGELIIPDNIKIIGHGAFAYCSGLSGRLNLPNSITSIGNGAFRECKGLTGDLVIPNNVTKIGMEAFYNCYRLSGELIIGNSVTTIENYAFQHCNGLTKLTLGSGLNYIGSCAFEYCYLNTINCLTIEPPTLETQGGNAFTGINKTNCILNVPVGSYLKYLTAIGWTDFVNIVEVVSELSMITNDNIRIYPNPVIDSFRINGFNGKTEIKLSDITGRIYLIRYIYNDESIVVKSLPNGVYFISISTEGGIVEKKIIKK